MSISPADVVMLLDATSWPRRQRDLAAAVAGHAAASGCAVRCAWLGETTIMGTIPGEGDAEGRSARGAFITPAVEAGVFDATAPFNLVLFASRPVPDMQDWRPLLESANALVVSLDKPAAVDIGLRGLDATTIKADALESRLLDAVFSDAVLEVEVSAARGALASLSHGFELVANPTEGCRYVWSGRAPSLSFDVGTLGGGQTAVRVVVRGARGQETAVDLALAGADKPAPADRRSCEDVARFRQVMAAIEAGESQMRCPVCGSDHVFIEPFLCERRTAGPLTRGAPLLDVLAAGRHSSATALLDEYDVVSAWDVGDRSLAHVGGLVLARRSEGFAVVTRDSGVRALREVAINVYKDDESGLVVVLR